MNTPPCRLSLLTLWAATLTILPSSGFAAQTLTDTQVDRALEAIWLQTPSAEKRSPDAAKRAALEAYLTRLGPGTAIVSKADTVQNEAPFAASAFHSEVITPSTGYIRLGTFSESLSKRVEPALRDFKQIGVQSVILDLRATTARGTLALSGEIASYFLPEGVEVIKIQSSKQGLETIRTGRNQVAQFRLLILTGTRTAGPVEALAAALRAHGGALIIGVPTPGHAADFDLVPLGKDTFLKMPVREAVSAGSQQEFTSGLHPDIHCHSTPEETDAALLKETQEGRVVNLLKETERPRLNEAALVANKNPETEFWIQTQLGRAQTRQAPLPRDAALTMALDFLAGWDALYGRSASLP